MRPEEFKIAIKRYNEEIESVLMRKGNDYAKNEDILSYAKVASNICGILNVDVSRRDGVLIFFIIHKVIRLCNILFNDKDEVHCETLDDTLRDIVGYVYLLRGYFEDTV